MPFGTLHILAPDTTSAGLVLNAGNYAGVLISPYTVQDAAHVTPNLADLDDNTAVESCDGTNNNSSNYLVIGFVSYTLAANERVYQIESAIRSPGGPLGAARDITVSWGTSAGGTQWSPPVTFSIPTSSAGAQNYVTPLLGGWPGTTAPNDVVSQSELDSLQMRINSSTSGGGSPCTAFINQARIHVWVVTQPTVVVTGPSGTNPGLTHSPTITWASTMNDGMVQANFQVKVFDLGSNPNPVWTDATPYDSGFATGSNTTFSGFTFPNGNYRAFVSVAKDVPNGTGHYWSDGTAHTNFTISDVPPAPTGVGPTGAITGSYPTFTATLAQSNFPGAPFVRARWRTASDAGFNTNVLVFDEANSLADGGGPHAALSNTPFTQGTWYVQAAAVDTTGVASAWSATSTFSVSHPMTAINLIPRGGLFPIGNVTFSWDTFDTEPSATQSAYQVVVTTQGGAPIADTGKILSSTARSVTLNFPTPNLLAWKIQLWDDQNIAGGFSTPINFQVKPITKWTFTDPTTNFTFEINPTDGPALPNMTKHPGYTNGLGPGGGNLVFEQHDDPQILTWTGTIWTQTMYDALVGWYQRRYPFNLIDDLGNVFTVYIETFTPKRVYSAQLPLRMTYTMSAVVLASYYASVVVGPPPPPNPTPPNAPTNVTATQLNSTSANVAYAIPSDGGSPITGYIVLPYIGGVAQAPQTFNNTASSQTVTGLSLTSSRYTFTVAATNAIGTGPESVHSNQIPPGGNPTVPAAPSGQSASAASATSAIVSYTAPFDGGSPITGYVVIPYIGGVAQSSQTFANANTSQTVTGLTSGQTYTFTIAAINAIGTGPPSGQTNAVTLTAGTNNVITDNGALIVTETGAEWIWA